MSSDENRLLVQRFLTRWAEGAAPDLIPEFVAGSASERYGASLLGLLIRQSFAGFQAMPAEIIAEGDTVVCRLTWSGTHLTSFADVAPSGKRVQGELIQTFRVADGRIIESWQSWDLAGLLQTISGNRQEPILDVEDIQGNIVPGFNKDHQAFLFCQISDIVAARRWFGHLASQIATLGEVANFNRLFKTTKRRRQYEGVVKANWINIAFTYPGLVRLLHDAGALTSPAFKEGIASRLAILGEVDGPGHEWVVGGPGKEPDFMVLVASDDAEDLADLVNRIRGEQRDAFRILWHQAGSTLPKPQSGHELFGFRDGISQPGVRGRLSAASDDFLTARENPANQDEGKPGQELVWPGEFLLGYPKAPDIAGALEGAPQWARNGSFLVFRRFRQDVNGFQSFLKTATESLRRRYPALSRLTTEKLGAMLVGRWASGAPIMRARDVDIPELGNDVCANNHFQFVASSSPVEGGPGECRDMRYPQSHGDPNGLVCPFAAHIRKVSPRDDLERAGFGPNRHHLLRRGIPYNDDGGRDQGLLFLCYQASIDQQFEFVMQNWANNPDFRRPGEGVDPIVGRAPGKREITIPIEDTSGNISAARLELAADWTIDAGSCYLFAPSVSTVRRLAEG